MSQENAEVARRVIDAFNRRDVEGFASDTTEDFELFPAMIGVVEGEGFRGRDGIERYFEVVTDTWEELSVADAQYRDLGDLVVLLCRIEGRGRGSGVPVDGPQGMVFDFRIQRTARIRGHLDQGEALGAVGLAE